MSAQDVTPSPEEPVSNLQLSLELRALRSESQAFRSEVKYWIVAGVVGSQALSHIQLPPVAGYVGGAAVVGLAFLKIALSR